jgi:hypothetical protein
VKSNYYAYQIRSGQLLSLMFEDLFKRFVTAVKKNLDTLLQKHNPATPLNPGLLFETSMRAHILTLFL